MRVVYVSRDSLDLPKANTIRDAVIEEIPNIDFKIVCGERHKTKIVPQQDVYYPLSTISDTADRFADATDAELAQELSKYSEIAPPSIYRADQRHIRRIFEPRQLAIEQVHLLETAKRLFEEWHPDVLFTVGGANLARNIYFLTAQSMGVKSFRILPTHYLTPGRKGLRYWFSTNNVCRLSNDAADQFGYSAEDIKLHADELINTVRQGHYKLANYARGKRNSRMTHDLRSLGQDALNILQSKPGADISRKKIRSAWNQMHSRRLAEVRADSANPYLLFPLNVPDDAQLTLRAPQMVDLFSVCQQLANCLPLGVDLLLREHPGSPGMLDANQLRALLKRNSNVRFMGGDVEFVNLLTKSIGVVTINSTAGFEAIVAGHPVLLLGEAFYKGGGATYDVTDLHELPKSIGLMIDDPLRNNREEKAHFLISRILNECHPAPGVILPIEEDVSTKCLATGIIAKTKSFAAHGADAFIKSVTK